MVALAEVLTLAQWPEIGQSAYSAGAALRSAMKQSPADHPEKL